MKYIFLSLMFFCQIQINAQNLDDNNEPKDNSCKIYGKYPDKLEMIKGKYAKGSFLSLLGLDNSVSDTVILSIIKGRSLKVEFKDKYGPCYELFEGKQKKSYFQFYLVKKRIYIPLIYSNVNIHRFRIKCLDDGNIEIKEYYNNSSNVFLMAAGGQTYNTYLLKK